MAATSAPAVKKKLLELIKASSAFKGVQVRYAHPGDEIQQEAVYYHRTIEAEKAVAFGNKRRDELYFFEVIIDVVVDGPEPETAEGRCYELVSALEEIVRNNPGRAGDAMAGLVIGYVVFRGTEMTPSVPSPSQYLAEAICKVEVLNRK